MNVKLTPVSEYCINVSELLGWNIHINLPINITVEVEVVSFYYFAILVL